jgi:hypothetical protein
LEIVWYRGRGVRLSSAKAATTVRVCSVPQNPLLKAGFYLMLTKEDENFLKYWSGHRLRKRPFFGMASVGLRLGVFIAIGLALAIVAAKFSRKANPVIENNASMIITVMIAGLGIVFFITYFTGQHKWDQNELHYQELLKKKRESGSADSDILNQSL